jgi:hypothetical protein
MNKFDNASSNSAQPLDSEASRELLSLLEEMAHREERASQSEYGWYDEDGVRHGGLIAFVRYFWKVLEPERKLADGWPLWAMCEHLEAVTRGEIQRLLINIFPGCNEIRARRRVLGRGSGDR